MRADQVEKLTRILRNVRAFEKERVDQYFDFAEAALSVLVESETESRSATGVFAGEAGGEPGLLSKAKLAKRLGISTRTISDLMTEGLPCVRFGKRVQFDYDDVLAWSKGRTIETLRKSSLRMVG